MSRFWLVVAAYAMVIICVLMMRGRVTAQESSNGLMLSLSSDPTLIEPNVLPVRAPTLLKRDLRRSSGGSSPTRPSTYMPTQPTAFCRSIIFGVNETSREKCSHCVAVKCIWCDKGDYCFSGVDPCTSYRQGDISVCKSLPLAAAIAIIVVAVIVPIVFCCAAAGGLYFYFYSMSKNSSVAPAGYGGGGGYGSGQPQQIQMANYSQVPQQAYAQPMQAQSLAYGQPQAYAQPDPQQAYAQPAYGQPVYGQQQPVNFRNQNYQGNAQPVNYRMG